MMSRGNQSEARAAKSRAEAGRLRRDVLSWLGLVLLGMNVLTAGLFASSASQPAAAAFTQEITAGRIVICTAAGMLVLDKDGQPIPDQNGMNGGISCVFCLPLMHGGVDAPDLSLAVLDAPLAAKPELPSAPAVILPTRHLWHYGAPSPRAPPIV
ncbi:MAG: DUF2946 family protein [Rhodospirillales bacterium]|nr:DUF2946 family protein [Rhodospirillales bacterium]